MLHPEWDGRRAAGATLTFLLLLVSILPTAHAGTPNTRTGARNPRSAAHDADATDWTVPHVTGEMLVSVADPGAPAVQMRFAAARMPIIRTMPQLDLALVRVEEAVDAPAADEPEAMSLAADQAMTLGASWSEPNYLFNLDFVPNDPDYASRQSPYLSRLEMPAAWDKTRGRPEIVIAILDTGINMLHEDLSAGIWTNPGEIPGNGLDDEGNGFIDDVHGWDFAGDDNMPDDDHGHGTHVAGIAAARISNGKGIAGIAGNATLMPVDVFKGGIGAYADLIQAILYAADNGASVINMSLGATSYSRGEEAAVNYAWNRGVVVVAAAGNSYGNRINYPAAHANAIAVAATNSLDERASFSTWGDFVDVAAPGVAIWSSSYLGSYQLMSGTSMAAPHVSGLAALLFSADPGLTPAQVRALVEQNSDDLGTPGWDPYFGHGRINARRALENIAVVPGPIPSPSPVPKHIWPAGCTEIVQNGSFEDGTTTHWETENVSALAVAGPDGQSTLAAQFPGGVFSHNTMSQEISGPELVGAATLAFFFRIETTDLGVGSSWSAPWDDSFTVEFRDSSGTTLRSLLRTGNSADTSGDGLAWDEYLYVLSPEDLRLLEAHRPITISFETQNDADTLTTTVWVDDVRLCASEGKRVYLPLVSH